MSSVTLTWINFIVHFILIFLRTEGQLFEGSRCSINGNSGICTILPKCTVVYNELLSGKPPERICGYSNFDPIVCCPKDGQSNRETTSTSTTTTTTTTTIRPMQPNENDRGALARAKCQEYSQYVYELQYPPILTFNAKPVNVSVCGVKGKTLIIGGTIALPKEFPHMVAIGYDSSEGILWNCGGTLVSERYVLTAAHCTYSQDWGGASWARVGDLNLARTDDNARPKNYRIIKRIRYPKYKTPSQYHDIALFKLEANVKFNAYVRPACLQTTLPDAPENKATATGWGLVDWQDETGSDNLLKVTLNIVPQSSCNESFNDGIDIQLLRGIVSDWQLCAGGLGRDTCQGDSGGPLVIFNEEHYCMYNIIGVTSLGRLCGTNIPGVYTRVYNYIPWLESVIWGENN
ncbi:hypothetical protein HZH66_006360 [Vespula vulgaris]|uniref:Peptidase S1 domain-containing protein n=1 Tax=Vespula vulgaris TaxID=7454 RepID=A0A834N8P1_VESVU|nr:serine protease snake-like [Vespula vulgaris]KAF7398463.1 hypothetical protein HZH66_006360 [Vespula vulgaris]